MSADQHLNPNQLAMFMPAHAIHALTLGDASDQSPAGKADLLDHKHDENVHQGVYWSKEEGGRGTRKSIFDREGVKEPLEIAHAKQQRMVGYKNNQRVYETSGEETRLDEGHHRLAWAMNKDPKTELPVEHFAYGH